MLQSELHNSNIKKRESEPLKMTDYLFIIAKHKILICSITSMVTLLTILFSLLLPETFVAKAKILPVQQDQGLLTALISNQGGGLASIAADLAGKGGKTDYYIELLKSESLKNAILQRFKLRLKLKIKYLEDAYDMLDHKTTISSSKKVGTISIEVEDTDPKMAADMANAYIDELGKLIFALNTKGVGQSRQFLEQRLLKANAELGQAEEALKEFQIKNKTLDVREQAKVTIESVAKLRAQLAINEVELATKQRSMTDSSQEVKNLKASISNLRAQVAKVEGSSGGGALPSVGSVPGLGESYVRLMREFKTQEAIVELLTKQNEMAKISEVNNIAPFQVVQEAQVPGKKFRPQKRKMVMRAALSSFVAAVFLAFVLEYLSKMPEEEQAIWKRLCRDFRTFKVY